MVSDITECLSFTQIKNPRIEYENQDEQVKSSSSIHTVESYPEIKNPGLDLSVDNTIRSDKPILEQDEVLKSLDGEMKSS